MVEVQRRRRSDVLVPECTGAVIMIALYSIMPDLRKVHGLCIVHTASKEWLFALHRTCVTYDSCFARSAHAPPPQRFSASPLRQDWLTARKRSTTSKMRLDSATRKRTTEHSVPRPGQTRPYEASRQVVACSVCLQPNTSLLPSSRRSPAQYH